MSGREVFERGCLTCTGGGGPLRRSQSRCGSRLWLQEHADSTGAAIYLPEEPEAVLLGAALLGAVASGAYASIPDAMRAMCRSASVIAPNPETAEYHAAKFAVYQELYTQQEARREQMQRYQ